MHEAVCKRCGEPKPSVALAPHGLCAMCASLPGGPLADFRAVGRCSCCGQVKFSVAKSSDGLCDPCGGRVLTSTYCCPSCAGFCNGVLHGTCYLCGWQEDKPRDETARHVAYWDYDEDAGLSCGACGWSGHGAGNEVYENILANTILDPPGMYIRCPQCKGTLINVDLASDEDTIAAAAAGNRRAEAELPDALRHKARLERAEELKLRSGDQLPKLAGTELRIDWDYEERDGEQWTVLSHDGEEIWRELAFYEGYQRFTEVFKILRQRYSPGLTEVRPTESSKPYLYGDSFWASAVVRRLNESLRPVLPE